MSAATNNTDSLLGLQLDEYRLDEQLGKGGMARVYRTLDVQIQRYAAVKIINTPYRQDEDYLVRFEREARHRPNRTPERCAPVPLWRGQ